MEGFNSSSNHQHSDVQLRSPQPKKPLTAGTIMLIIMVSVLLIIIVPLSLFWFWAPFDRTPDYPMDVFSSVGLRVENYSDGNWTILVTGGSEPVSSVLLIIVIPTNGTQTVVKALANLTPSNNDPDADYYDTNDNKRIDAGDTLVLKTTGGHILAGYKVMLLRDYVSHSLIVGSIKTLPA
jgi:hypothetical protein